jgi:hypothetical protein
MAASTSWLSRCVNVYPLAILILLIGPSLVREASPEQQISSCRTSTAEVIDGAALASKGGLSRLCHRLLLHADNVNTEVVT